MKQKVKYFVLSNFYLCTFVYLIKCSKHISSRRVTCLCVAAKICSFVLSFASYRDFIF